MSALPFGFGQDGSPFPPHPSSRQSGQQPRKSSATATASAPPRPPPLPQGARDQEMQWRQQNGYSVQPSYPVQSFAPGQLIIPQSQQQQKPRASSFSPISPGAAPYASGPRYPSAQGGSAHHHSAPLDMPNAGYYRSVSVGPQQAQQQSSYPSMHGNHAQARSYDDRPPAGLPTQSSSSYHVSQPRRASHANVAPPTPAPAPAPSATPAPGSDLRRGSADAPNLAMPLTDIETLTSRREKALASGLESMKLDWARMVVRYVERVHADTLSLTDPLLIRYVDEAMAVINRRASATPPDALGLYLRGDLKASGNFPSYHRKDPKNAFNDFELSGRLGHAPSWFRIGRDYETLNDPARAREAYARGQALRDVGCIYRLGMANLLGQIGVRQDYPSAMALLREAAELSNEETPQPSYILGMLYHGEFAHLSIPPHLLAPMPDPSNPRLQPTTDRTAYHLIERSAYLNFAPAQYKLGWAYEYAQLDCPFDPLLSVQYYSLASKGGEVEADMAVSKWFLCGADGCFDKNESLAYLFAEKAARRGLASAEFALAYYHEVGVGCGKDVALAKVWYKKAAARGNADAKERLEALQGSNGEEGTLSRSEHEAQLDVRLQRKHTAAQVRSEREGRRARGERQQGAQQQQQQQQQQGSAVPQETLSTGFEHLTLKNQQQGAQQPPASQASKPQRDVRRRQTMRMVDDAAAWSGHYQQHGAAPMPMPMPAAQPYRATTPTPAGPRQQQQQQQQQAAMATPPPRGRTPSSTMTPPTSQHNNNNSNNRLPPPAPFPSSHSQPQLQPQPQPHSQPSSVMMGRRTPSSQGGPPSQASQPEPSPPRKQGQGAGQGPEAQKFYTFEEMGYTSSAVGSGKDCLVM